jgi:hypothetical protein
MLIDFNHESNFIPGGCVKDDPADGLSKEAFMLILTCVRDLRTRGLAFFNLGSFQLAISARRFLRIWRLATVTF